jgi:Na+(H+)/acetate symporter ActP
VSRLAVAFWGIVACIVAHVAVQLGSLIEVVNRIGSIFYGSLLGVFVLALAFKRANGQGAFAGLFSGILFVVVFAFHPKTRSVSYLWHNPIGVAVVRGRRSRGEPADAAAAGGVIQGCTGADSEGCRVVRAWSGAVPRSPHIA